MLETVCCFTFKYEAISWAQPQIQYAPWIFLDLNSEKHFTTFVFTIVALSLGFITGRIVFQVKITRFNNLYFLFNLQAAEHYKNFPLIVYIRLTMIWIMRHKCDYEFPEESESFTNSNKNGSEEFSKLQKTQNSRKERNFWKFTYHS